MQYACGYVPYKLLRKYKEKNDLISAQYVECLENTAVARPEDGALRMDQQRWPFPPQ